MEARIKVIRTECYGGQVDYSAWECQGDGDIAWSHLGHSTIRTIDGEWFGRIGTRKLPAHLEALPAMTDKRIEAVQEWMRGEYAEAYDLIYAEHPEVQGVPHKKEMGIITVY